MIDSVSVHLQQYWMLWLFAFVAAVLALNLLVAGIFRLLLKRAALTKNAWDDAFLGSVGRPIEWAVWLFGINFAALFAADVNGLEWSPVLGQLNRTAAVLLIAWAFLRFFERAESNLVSTDFVREPMDITTAKAIKKLLHASVMITGALIILQIYGVSVSGVLAFGGIGGIAIGFAARDLLANFFGAMMIYLDKPFSVGEWIRSPDRDIEGTVEDIGWRQTRIRTFDKRPLYVPNSVFSSIAVENPSRMLNRRIYETIGVRYDDVSVLPSIIEGVRAMLRAHPEIDDDQTLIVNFNQFGPSSLDFIVYTFTRTRDWVQYHAIKQDILLKIEAIISGHGAQIAFPTRTLHVQGELADMLLAQSPPQ